MEWTEEQVTKLEELYPYETNKELEDKFNRDRQAIRKKAQRLGITKQPNHKGRTKIKNTELNAPEFGDSELNQFITGFVAGEGCFSKSKDGERDIKRHRFHVEVASEDRNVLEKIKSYFGVGKIYDFEARDENWSATSMYTVQKLGALTKVIIPFFDYADFRSTQKGEQYSEWKKSIEDTYDVAL